MSAATTQKYLSVARCDGVACQLRSGSLPGRLPGLVVLGGVPPDHGADAGQQHDDADAGPHDALAGRPVAHQRFVRPVVGVADHLAGPRVAAAHEVQKMNAAMSRILSGLRTVPAGMA